MDSHEYLKAYTLHGSTANERALYAGEKGRTYSNLFDNVVQNGVVLPGQVKGFRNFAEDLSGTFQNVTVEIFDGLRFLGERPIPDTTSHLKAVGIVREEKRDREFTAFNLLFASLRDTGAHTTILSFPVKWNMDHIEERMKDRRGGYLDVGSTMFRVHNSLAMSMLRIFEKQKPPGLYPFILPERNGVLVGHTIPLAPDFAKNRFAMAVARDRSLLDMHMERYEWIPTMHMRVNTFYGSREMTPAMHDVRKRLLPFYTAGKAAATQLEFESITNTINYSHVDNSSLGPQYLEGLSTLESIMGSHSWAQASRLPQQLRPSKLAR